MQKVDQYWRDGYLFPIQAMPSAEAAALRAELEQIEHDWLDNGLPQPLNTYKRLNAPVTLSGATCWSSWSSISWCAWRSIFT